MIRKLDILLGAKQIDLNNPLTDLGVSDFVDTLEPATIQVNPENQEDSRGSGGFFNYKSTIGKYEVEIPLTFKLFSLGNGNFPDVVRCLECAGFEQTLDEGYIKMKLNRAESDYAMTVWGYEGSTVASKADLVKVGNVVFGDWSFSAEVNQYVQLSLTGKGRYMSLDKQQTMPNIGTQREREIAPPFRGYVHIAGKDYRIASFEITSNQETDNVPDAGDATAGSGATEITNRNMTATFTVFQDSDSDLDPQAQVDNVTTGNMILRWGTNYNAAPDYDMQLRADDIQIRDVNKAERNGVATLELDTVILENSFEYWIYNGTSSSLSSTSYSISSNSLSSSLSSESSSSVSKV
jgi:hypothetical protein